MSAIQDLYPDDWARCYGCGRLNSHGLHIRSEWVSGEAKGETSGEGGSESFGEALARFWPEPHHLAVPGFVYGGLIASLIDCHAIGTAAAAAMVRAGQVPGRDPTPRFVTASLQVDFLRPTPIGVELLLRARPTAVEVRKALVEVTLTAGGEVCARGRVVAVPMPPSMAAAR